MPSASGKPDYYDTLGVSRSASEQEIKSAYRKLALKYHPDRNPGDKAAEERFKEAAEAYSVLGDADKRRRYDTFGHAGVSGGSVGFDPTTFADFGDILGDLFGFGDLFGRSRGGPRRGADLRYNLELTFQEAAFGTETHIQIPRATPCAACKGSGAAPGTHPVSCPTCGGAGQVTFQQGFFSVARTCQRCRGNGRIVEKRCPECEGEGQKPGEERLKVKIPAGVDSGSQLRLAGKGEGGAAGGPPGDLYVVVRVQEHPFFRREGPHLLCEVPVAITQAALGATVEIPSLEGDPTPFEIPAGTQTGTVFRLRGRGVPNLGGRGRGDLHVAVRVVVPKKLSGEQRKLLEKLAQTLTPPKLDEKADEDRSIFDRMREFLG
jgi:molecular chaperone DnaJ